MESVNILCHDLGSWHNCIYNSCKLRTNACYLCVVAFHCKIALALCTHDKTCFLLCYWARASTTLARSGHYLLLDFPGQD